MRIKTLLLASLVTLGLFVSFGAGLRLGSLLDIIRDKNTGIDPQMVKELGADDLGMKKYVMAFLKAGDKQDQDKDAANKLQMAHMANITKLASEGKLVLAGPFMDRGDIRGIYIFNTDDLEKAKAWTETDPAIQAGRLKLELKPWYGSASLQLVTDLHRRVQSKQFGETDSKKSKDAKN